MVCALVCYVPWRVCVKATRNIGRTKQLTYRKLTDLPSKTDIPILYYYFLRCRKIVFNKRTQGPTEEDEASKSGTDHHIRNFTSVWKQDTRIQELEEDGSQRDGGAALQGRGCGIRGFVGQLCGERRHVRERWSASEWQGGSSVCRGTVRGGRQRLG